MSGPRFGGDVCPAGPRKMGIEACPPAERTSQRRHRVEPETDDVAELVVKIVRRDAHAIRREPLFYSRVDGAALLGTQRRIAGKARIGSKGLLHFRLLNSPPIGKAQPRCAPQIFSRQL